MSLPRVGEVVGQHLGRPRRLPYGSGGPHLDEPRHHLLSAGYRPTVVTGDGALGWPTAAPYDRLIAIASVPSVPPSWVAQVRDGGVIVISLWRDLCGGPLVRLDVQGDTAQGFFLPQPGGFMPVRSAATTPAALSRAVKPTGHTRGTDVPSRVLHHPDAGLWLALRLPGLTWLGFTPDGGHDQTWLFAPTDPEQWSTTPTPH